MRPPYRRETAGGRRRADGQSANPQPPRRDALRHLGPRMADLTFTLARTRRSSSAAGALTLKLAINAIRIDRRSESCEQHARR
jgi:hypothetical protein